MAERTVAPLLASPLARVADVACRAPRSGSGPPERSRGELILPRSGVFVVHRRGGPVVADATAAVLLRPGEEYRVSHPGDHGDRCTALEVAPELLEEALHGARAGHVALTPATQLRVGLATAALRRGGAGPLAAEESALGLLDAAVRDAGGAGPAVTPAARRRADEVRALLASDPAAPWRLDAVARAVHCSPFHLARQFRAATGETLARHLTRLRLALALERIAAGEPSLARLAGELGFAHHSHLTARFRALFGRTPSEVRRIVTAGGPAGA